MTWHRKIGGEKELEDFPYHLAYTDSGRSSLRLILASASFQSIALPDFLCDIIIQVVEEFQLSIYYYKVNPDLTIQEDTIDDRAEAIYLINYFGQRQTKLINKSDQWIIEDNVFLMHVANFHDYPKWYGFNSYRKISNCAEGSLLVSSQYIDMTKINASQAPFVDSVYKAKAIKSEFINSKKPALEGAYLSLFVEGENQLNHQSEIYFPSPRGYFQMQAFCEQYEIEKSKRAENYACLASQIRLELYIPVEAEFRSFFILNIDRRDELRAALFKSSVFLPIHWQTNLGRNELEQRVLSIPIDSRYEIADMLYIGKLINSFI